MVAFSGGRFVVLLNKRGGPCLVCLHVLLSCECALQNVSIVLCSGGEGGRGR